MTKGVIMAQCATGAGCTFEVVAIPCEILELSKTEYDKLVAGTALAVTVTASFTKTTDGYNSIRASLAAA